MINLKRFDLATAHSVASDLAARLEPKCQCIEIAGSIRRKKPYPKDIEIVYIPEYQETLNLFGETVGTLSLIDAVIDDLVESGELAWDEQVKRAGPKYKRLIHLASEMVVELFAANRWNWGLILALRTGPGDFNKILVSKSWQGGAMPYNLEMREGHLWNRGQQLVITTEADFFQQFNLPCWAPEERTAERLLGYLRER